MGVQHFKQYNNNVIQSQNMSKGRSILVVVITVTLLILTVGVSYYFWLSDQTKSETTTFLSTSNSDQDVTMSPKFQTTFTLKTDLPTPLSSIVSFQPNNHLTIPSANHPEASNSKL